MEFPSNHQRQLQPADGVKPLDFGGNGLTSTLNQDGRLIAINTYHPEHGMVTLSSAAPLPDDKRADANAVQQYRQSLVTEDGFGLRMNSPIKEREITLLEDAIPYLKLKLENGVTAEVVTFTPEGIPSIVLQIWEFSEGGAQAVMDGTLRLMRCAYAQANETAPATMPSTHTQVLSDPNLRQTFLYNQTLRVLATSGRNTCTENADGSVSLDGGDHLTGGQIAYPQLTPGGDARQMVIAYGLSMDVDTITASLEKIRQRGVDQVLRATLNVWQTRWQNWPLAEHPLDRPMRRALVYATQCSVAINLDATSLVADHMLLPIAFNRDAYYAARALLDWSDEGAEIVRRHLIWLFESTERLSGDFEGAWARTYLANGRVKDGGFQLDQQIYPLLELAEYILKTRDVPTLERLRPRIADTIKMLMAHKAEKQWLFKTQETPDDRPATHPHHLSSHVLLWHTLRQLARLSITGDFENMAQRLHDAIQTHFIASHLGKKLYAYATDGQQQHRFHHDALDVPLALAPLWGFVGADDPVWRATMTFVFSNNNLTGAVEGRLRSPHSAEPSPLGDLQVIAMARAIKDATAEKNAQKRLAQATQWDGALPEAYETSGVASRHWFLWPNALLAHLYLAERRETATS